MDANSKPCLSWATKALKTAKYQDHKTNTPLARCKELLNSSCSTALTFSVRTIISQGHVSRSRVRCFFFSRVNRVENNFLAEESIFEGYEILPAHILGPGSKSFGG